MPQRFQDVANFDNVWEEAYQRLKTDSPKLTEAYETGILEETRSKCRDARAELLRNKATSAGKLQEQLGIVIEIQSEYIQERQWVVHVRSLHLLQV